MRHEFALYTAYVSTACLDKQVSSSITIADEQLWHRLKHVLRVQPDCVVCLFDETIAIEAQLCAFGSKNQLQFSIVRFIVKSSLTPHIIVMLPLLKKDALADALYSCVELGANHVQLITTEKSQHGWSADRDNQRCQKVMIAAAEQSKQFTLPIIGSPISLADALQKLPKDSFRVHCDPQGASLWTVLRQIEQQKASTLVLSFGPEGDLTDAERTHLYKNQFVASTLTPTVVRSTQALVIALGALRSGGSYQV